MIEFEFPQELLRLGEGEGPARRVLAYMENASHDALNEVLDAYQPERLRTSYDMIPQLGADGGSVEIISDDAILFNSFVGGSVPHWPYWGDPDLVKWANEHDIPPFLVAKAVSEHGTPPHPQIDDILASWEPRIADMGEVGFDEWFWSIGGLN